MKHKSNTVSKLSEHALLRCRERGIPIQAVFVTVNHGRAEITRSGATRYFLTREAAWLVSQRLGNQALKWEGVCVVVKDDVIVTAYWRDDCEHSWA